MAELSRAATVNLHICSRKCFIAR